MSKWTALGHDAPSPMLEASCSAVVRFVRLRAYVSPQEFPCFEGVELEMQRARAECLARLGLSVRGW